MKNIKIISGILIIILFFGITFVYANDGEKDIIYAKNSEVSVGENIELVLNIEKIEYTNFLVTISSNLDMTQVKESEDIEIEKSSDSIQINMDKETTNLKDLTLSYNIPDTFCDGDIITFEAIIQNNEDINEEITSKIEIKVVNKDEEKLEEDNEEVNEIDENQENKDENRDILETNNTDKTMNNNSNKSMVQMNQSQEFQSSDMRTASGGFSNSSSKNVETVTYNGSSNNYLSNLYVEGYDFTESFNKENETYFLTVSNDVENLTTKATAENENATVKIYGTENLKVGTNKILITVTAEDGSVRNYRIYVTRQEGE